METPPCPRCHRRDAVILLVRDLTGAEKHLWRCLGCDHHDFQVEEHDGRQTERT